MRPKMGSWLDRALAGEDVGVTWRGKIIALRPVEVHSADYAFTEYGLTAEETAGAEKKIIKRLKNEKTKRWNGTAKGLRG